MMKVEMSGMTFLCAKIPTLRRIKHTGKLGHNVLGRDSSKARAPAMAGIDAQATERLLCGSSSERGTE